jgi:hypothetical protein
LFEIVYLHLNVEGLDLHQNEYCINLVFVVLLNDLIKEIEKKNAFEEKEYIYPGLSCSPRIVSIKLTLTMIYLKQKMKR